MKSQPYASKRRLTNICCFVVTLAITKLVFVAYIMGGGVLPEFKKTEELSPRAAVLAREHNKQGAEAVPSAKSSATMVAEPAKPKQNMQVAENVVSKNTLAEGNPNGRISFLPKGDKQNEQVRSAQLRADKSRPVQKNDILENHVSQNAQKARLVADSMAKLEKGEPHDGDIILASASMNTANTARANMRNHLMASAFANWEGSKEESALDNMESQKSNYKKSPVQPVVSADAPAQKNSSKKRASKKSSFFGLVGQAQAAEEEVPYVRPDENVNIPLPAPKVSPYASPNSLDYKRAELNRKEEELLALQQQMNARVGELNELEGRLGTMVQDASSVQGEKFKHLVDTYANMKARRAAEALIALDEDIAVRILSGMKSKQSGEIFSYMDPVHAARLSAAMTDFSL